MSIIHSFLVSAVEMCPLVVGAACIGAMVMLFIKAAVMLRMQNEETIRHSSISQSNVRVPRLTMTRVHIPFTFRLIENGSTDEVQFAITSQVKYTLQAFWVVSIRELHVSLWRPWKQLRDTLQSSNGTILEASHCKTLARDLKSQSAHNEKIMKLKSPKPPMVLGAPPRLAYPLVVFLIRDNDEDDTNLHPDETVVLVNIVHLRDPVCPLPTSILAQYLKQASGQLSCLKQLYLATGDSIASDEIATQQNGSLSLAEPVAGSNGALLCSDKVQREGQQQDQLCVVCHYFPLSRALLPCRHTCICAVCFSKLDRCPMCRASITSYFCIRAEDYVPPATMEQQLSDKNKSTSAVHWLDALNDRLTDFLGFR